MSGTILLTRTRTIAPVNRETNSNRSLRQSRVNRSSSSGRTVLLSGPIWRLGSGLTAIMQSWLPASSLTTRSKLPCVWLVIWALQPISSRTAALPLVARIGTARSEVPKMFTQCRLPILTASIAASSQRHRYSVRRLDCADVYGSFPCPLWLKSGHVQCTNVKAEGLALFRDRAIVANFIFMGDTVRSGLGARGEAAIIRRKVYANVA